MIAPRIALLVAVLVLTASVDLFAQQVPPVGPGDRVRVTAPTIDPDPFVGTVVSMAADTFVLAVEGRAEPWALPLASLTNLELSRGKKGHTLVGAGVGFVVGAVGSHLVAAASGEADATFEISPLLLAVGGGGGLALGALIGSFVKTDRWEAVPLDRIRVSLTPQGLKVSASIVF